MLYRPYQADEWETKQVAQEATVVAISSVAAVLPSGPLAFVAVAPAHPTVAAAASCA